MDGAVLASWREGGSYQGGSTSNPNLFYIVLQTTPWAVPTYRWPITQILVGLQRWKEEDLLGGVGGHAKATVF